MLSGAKVKKLLGELPLTAELDWVLRGRRAPLDGFKLDELEALLPEWCQQVESSPRGGQRGKKILLFSTLHYWMSHAALLSLALAGLGNDVTYAYLPYSTWKKPLSKYDQRRREAYIRSVFKPARKLINIQSFTGEAEVELPDSVRRNVEQVSLMDAQYTLQVEDVDHQSNLYKLRLQRNMAAARAVMVWLGAEQPKVVILPNALILEFGAVFHVARYLNIPVVSYEFGEQRDRIWLSRNTPVMLQETEAMWKSKKNDSFTEDQRKKVQNLFATRKSAALFENFYRRWQNVPSEGSDAVRSKLRLDGRPVVLLAANVIGDSLTLGRADFTGDMTKWLLRTVDYFAKRNDVQFLLRVHPGERNLDGPSVADLVHSRFPVLPEHFRVIDAEGEINTYDLVAIADLGLVYTTTVGLEMAMSGVPVIVAGKTHYRGKGFTIDPESWDEYFDQLENALKDQAQLTVSDTQIDLAWHYAYAFFFEYPQFFPWHLLHVWKDVEKTPLSYLFSDKGYIQYARTIELLLGEPFEWESAE